MDIGLNTIDSVLASSMADTIEFIEFCNTLDRIKLITDSTLYLSEEVNHVDDHRNPQLEKIVKNTAETTKQIGKLYGITTDAGGAAIKSVWDLFMKLATLAANALLFITKKVILIPQMITKLIDLIASIPREVKLRIRGDIKLYITINDIQAMNDRFILEHMMNFITITENLSKGEIWTSLTKSEAGRGDGTIHTNDMQLIKKMKKEYSYFSSLQFNQTVVDMSDPSVVEGYFGNGKIKFVDIHGTEYNQTYYESLKHLISSISSKKNELDVLYKELGDKLKRTTANSAFANLSNMKRNSIVNAMTMVSTTIALIGNIVRYMIKDLDTIQKATNQILNRKDAIAKGAKKKLLGRSDDGIKDLDINNAPKEDVAYINSMKKKGYVKISRYAKDKTGKVIKEFQGEVDRFNKEAIWVDKNNIPKGAKRM